MIVAIVRISFSEYVSSMDAVDRETLVGLLAEALMRDSTFRPRGRHWAADADRSRIEAQICAASLVDHLHRCGIRFSRLPPAQPHTTP